MGHSCPISRVNNKLQTEGLDYKQFKSTRIQLYETIVQ